VDEQRQPRFEVIAAQEVEGGSYANFLSVWHTPFEFTLDFCSTLPTRQDEEGTPVVPCRVVSRVKIPTTMIFDVLRALNENMTRYEATYGEIRRPLQPPDGDATPGT
jgi:hypothetical protein